jgi:hypothetical protein
LAGRPPRRPPPPQQQKFYGGPSFSARTVNRPARQRQRQARTSDRKKGHIACRQSLLKSRLSVPRPPPREPSRANTTVAHYHPPSHKSATNTTTSCLDHVCRPVIASPSLGTHHLSEVTRRFADDDLRPWSTTNNQTSFTNARHRYSPLRSSLGRSSSPPPPLSTSASLLRHRSHYHHPAPPVVDRLGQTTFASFPLL